jgi:hypothetical protein
MTDHFPGATEMVLSPAARAVMDAVMGQDAEPYPLIAAAVLRAAAYQVVPNDELASPVWTEREEVRAALLAIAAELENQP